MRTRVMFTFIHFVVLIVFCRTVVGQGQIESHALNSTGARLYPDLLKSVAWIVTDRGSGTGFVVRVSHGQKRVYLVTNYHVVANPYGASGTFERVDVYFPVTINGELQNRRDKYKQQRSSWATTGVVLKAFGRRDLALIEVCWKEDDDVLKIKARGTIPQNIQALSFAKEIHPGESVHSIGNPGVSDALWVYTSGKVRAISEIENSYDSGSVSFQEVSYKSVETQSPINPGDSGGPVVNENGELVGINSAASGDASLFTHAIHVEELREKLDDSREWGESMLPSTHEWDDLAKARWLNARALTMKLDHRHQWAQYSAWRARSILQDAMNRTDESDKERLFLLRGTYDYLNGLATESSHSQRYAKTCAVYKIRNLSAREVRCSYRVIPNCQRHWSKVHAVWTPPHTWETFGLGRREIGELDYDDHLIDYPFPLEQSVRGVQVRIPGDNERFVEHICEGLDNDNLNDTRVVWVLLTDDDITAYSEEANH